MKKTVLRLRTGVLSCLALQLTPVFPRDIPVADVAALSAALASAEPDDAIVLAKGHWNDMRINVGRGGAEGKPLVIRAEVPGEVVLGGYSDLQINAPYVTVDGLFFYEGSVEKGSVIAFNSHHGIVKNTAIVDFNPAAFKTRYYWVFFSGDHNLIDQSYFKGKNNLEPLIGNAIEGSRHNAVTNSYFKNVPYVDANGREIIRVWGTGKFDQFVNDGAYFTIQGNLFDHAHGEGVEIISLKSNFNKVIGNTIVDTLGGVNIRRGANNLVQGNIILCHGMKGASGLRMSGPNHTVEDNYVSNCDYGIRVSAGEDIATGFTDKFEPHLKANSRGTKHAKDNVITMYPQVTNLILRRNVVVNSAGADLNVGSDYMKHWPAVQMVLLPEKNLIEGNRFVRPLGGVSIVGARQDLSGPLSSLQFQANQFRDNQLVGGSNSFPEAAGGVVNLPMPPNWTEKDESMTLKPLTPADVGPAWVRSARSGGNFPMEEDACCRIDKSK